METNEEKTIREVEKVLKEPVAAQFSDQAWKIRNNLIIISTIAFIMGFAKLQINADSSILGLKFTGLNDSVIRTTLAVIIIYLLSHFLWIAWDSLLEWRLRITGTRSAFQTGASWPSQHADFPSDPRQSTLYNWWTQQRIATTNVEKLASELKKSLTKWEEELQKLKNEKPEFPDIGNVIHGLAETRQQAMNLAQCVEENIKIVANPRITTSLKRFDHSFHFFLRSQNLRWLLIEFVAPVCFAIISLYQLLKN